MNKGNITIHDLGFGHGRYGIESKGEYPFLVRVDIQDLKDLHSLLSELLETHTVKETETTPENWADGRCNCCGNKGICLCSHVKLVNEGKIDYSTNNSKCKFHGQLCPCEYTNGDGPQPSNSEKEECCEMVKNGQGFHNLSCHKEEIKEQPTTPETKVKISCPDCPHEETDTPEKKCSDESMVASGYIKTPTGWIAQGEATPAQMVYHVSYEVTCGRCEKSIKHSCGRV